MPTDLVTANRNYQKPYADNDIDHDIARLIAAFDAIDVDIANTIASIAGFATLVSPAFTGVPTAPTAAPGNSSSQLSTTAFVQAALAAMVDSSPAALDTLNELAAALNDDPDFATTMTNALAAKLALAGGTITGDLEVNGNLTQNGLPVRSPGQFFWYIGDAPPTGSLVADGSLVSRSLFSGLFAVSGERFGSGDGSTTFAILNVLGRVVRAVDSGAGIDPDAASRTDRGDGTIGDAVGTKQADEFKAHTHGGIPSIANNGASGSSADARQLGAITTSVGGAETRMINIYLLPCIWY